MSWKNKVVWSEGLFLQPQHFQQHDRYLEAYVEGRCGGLRPHGWGFSELKLDAAQLGIGKVAIASARGVFPDGTPFNIPEDDRPPAPIDLNEQVRECRVYLALPARRFGELAAEAAAPIDDVRGTGRYRRHALAVMARRTLTWAWNDHRNAGRRAS